MCALIVSGRLGVFALKTSAPRFAEQSFMEYRASELASLRLDAAEFDHLGPLFGFVGDQLGQVSGRARKRRAAELSETGLDRGIGESGIDFLVEPVDDLGRRGLRCADAEPETRFVARHKLTHGRDVRQRVRARRGGYCEHTRGGFRTNPPRWRACWDWPWHRR